MLKEGSVVYFICSTNAVRNKYGNSAQPVLDAVGRLGQLVDVSGLTPEAIRAKVAALEPGPVCLVGGYDLIPPFIRSNPVPSTQDDDKDIPTDAPYGAKPGHPSEEYAPSRAVCRIPDSAVANAQEFLSTLNHQIDAPKTPTPAGSFEEGADEFSGAIKYVHSVIPGAKSRPRLSPPDDITIAKLSSHITGHGRIHILLHGANYDPDWAFLWGHANVTHSKYIKALSAPLFDLCDLRGAIVSFSTCYATMIDVAPALDGARTTGNQVALACLSHGAKVVFGATRSNWIDTVGKCDGFGPGLMAEVWRQLAKGQGAAEALRKAKAAYLKVALSGSASDRPYALKTVLQAQCYGHPAAKL